MYLCMYMYIYIYIKCERERDVALVRTGCAKTGDVREKLIASRTPHARYHNEICHHRSYHMSYIIHHTMSRYGYVYLYRIISGVVGCGKSSKVIMLSQATVEPRRAKLCTPSYLLRARKAQTAKVVS